MYKREYILLRDYNGDLIETMKFLNHRNSKWRMHTQILHYNFIKEKKDQRMNADCRRELKITHIGATPNIFAANQSSGTISMPFNSDERISILFFQDTILITIRIKMENFVTRS